jgi:hypothetical protein
VCVCVCGVCNSPHVGVGDTNDLQVPDILDFKRTETRGNRILNCLQHFCIFILYV